VKQDRAHVGGKGQKEQIGENRMAKPQNREHRDVVARNPGKMDRSVENDRTLGRREHRPPDQWLREEQRVEEVFRPRGDTALDWAHRGQERRRPVHDPVKQTDNGEGEDRYTQGPVDGEQQRVVAQRGNHGDTDEQLRDDHRRHRPVQQPGQQCEAWARGGGRLNVHRAPARRRLRWVAWAHQRGG